MKNSALKIALVGAVGAVIYFYFKNKNKEEKSGERIGDYSYSSTCVVNGRRASCPSSK